MKKISKLALSVFAASFFVTATPTNANYFPSQENSLEKTVKCVVSERPDTARAHTFEEISQLVQKVYRCTFYEPDHFSEKLVRELILKESKYNPSAVSKKGAGGLMQLMPIAWNQVEKECSYEEGVFDPITNLKVGMKYLLYLDEFLKDNHPGWEELSVREKRKIILASYNGGISRLAERGWNVNRMYEETRDYVKNIDKSLGD